MVKETSPPPGPIDPTPPGRRGRRRRLTREEIADAVIAVGFDRATMTAVAEHLRVNHATLYGHVTGRDDMVLAAVDRVLGATAWPEPSPDWRACLEREARHLWHLYLDHPGLPEAIGGAPSAPRTLTGRYTALAEHLLAIGFAPDAAMAAQELVYHLTADAAVRERYVRAAGPDLRRQWEADWSTPLSDPLRQAMARTFRTTPEERFDLLLDVVLTGIATRLAP